jgi:serine/threonine protein phosphatase PrpC
MITLDYAGLSEQGPVRDNNEDFIACQVPPDSTLQSQKGCLFTIADGVGGNRAGEVASRAGTEKLIEMYYAGGKHPLSALQRAFKQTNLHICDLGMSNPAYRRMATTLSAIVLVSGQAHIGHVGDTRIYQLRDSSIQQLTRDHSEVGELVRMQILTPEEAQRHPRRHIITRSIGEDLMTRIDYRSEPVRAGDSFVLCTDGLWEPLAMNEIAEVVQSATAAAACQRLVALALDRGSDDNLSVQVIKVVELAGDALETSTRKNGFFRRTFNLIGNALS